ncbi:peptidoglycan-binding protein [Rathayibacter rathayi]|nr:peptidoglycan-binding protein [Rathayibacter rathayi]PPG91035.1 peptidoglycan-binding protein [Rathayibacter rathayi]
MTTDEISPLTDALDFTVLLRERSSRRRIAPVIGGVLLILLVGAGVGWSAARVLAPEPPTALDIAPFTFVAASTGQVGQALSVTATAQWNSSPAGTNRAVGTVTTVEIEAGEEVTDGAEIYSVDLRPVVIAQGEIPAFRDVTVGSVGADVQQLQAMLAALDFYDSPIDGVFGVSTKNAVQAWQRLERIDTDGIVKAGDILYLPTLPARLSLDTDRVKRGASLVGGEELVQSLPESPEFTIVMTPAQAQTTPRDTRVEIGGPVGHQWQGFTSDRRGETSDGNVRITLSGAEGSPICGNDCASVPVTGSALLSSRLITVESVTGITVPTAALLTDADGSIAVTDDQGLEHAVTVTASARGMSVVDGVTEGLPVRVPAQGQ